MRLFSLAIAVLISTSVFADGTFRVCNKSNSIVNVAIGYQGDTASDGIITEGWFSMHNADCKKVATGLKGHKMLYLYAESLSGLKWTGDGTSTFCYDPHYKFFFFKAEKVTACKHRANYMRAGSVHNNVKTITLTP